jgi:hypothetical protein
MDGGRRPTSRTGGLRDEERRGPLTEAEIEEFLEGRSEPRSSLQLHAFLSSLAEISPGSQYGYGNRLNLAWNQQSGVFRFPGPDAPAQGIFLTHAVEVAAYLGAAGLGGIIGNRTDAATGKVIRALFLKARTSWQERSSGPDEPMLLEEAADVARGAVLTMGGSLESVTVQSAHQDERGSWWFVVNTQRDGVLDQVSVLVGGADPERERVIIAPMVWHDPAPEAEPPNEGEVEEPSDLGRLARSRIRQMIMAVRGEGGWSRATRPWYCVHCGWKSYARRRIRCGRCDRARPVALGDITMRRCHRCAKFSVALGEYCEWCGTRRPADP